VPLREAHLTAFANSVASLGRGDAGRKRLAWNGREWKNSTRFSTSERAIRDAEGGPQLTELTGERDEKSNVLLREAARRIYGCPSCDSRS